MNWLKASDDVCLSTGEITQSDTIRVSIPIDIIRKANIKLNERIKLKQIVMNQELQITEYRNLIDLKNTKIDNLEDKILSLTKINSNLKDNIDKINKQKDKYLGITIGVVTISVGVIIGLLVF